jgi:hypothetical protein
MDLQTLCISVEAKKFLGKFLVVNVPLERFQNARSQEKDAGCGTFDSHFGKGREKTSESIRGIGKTG